ncbi:hypothetical protein F444_21216, partial [Phytophthora nicotianae P1976]
KKSIAKAPASNAVDLNIKVAESFEKVRSKHWVDVYRSVQKVENTYFTKIEECDLGSNSDYDTAIKEEEEEKGALDVDSEDWDE